MTEENFEMNVSMPYRRNFYIYKYMWIMYRERLCKIDRTVQKNLTNTIEQWFYYAKCCPTDLVIKKTIGVNSNPTRNFFPHTTKSFELDFWNASTSWMSQQRTLHPMATHWSRESSFRITKTTYPPNLPMLHKDKRLKEVARADIIAKISIHSTSNTKR